MRVYDSNAEATVRTGKLVREWTRSGLLEQAQANVMSADLRTDLRRTNLVLRIVLFGFTMSVLQSILGIVFLFISSSDKLELGTTAVIVGPLIAVLAERLIARAQFYRFGVEEACAVLAAALTFGGLTLIVSAGNTDFPVTASLLMASLAGLALYMRYGYLYAALVSVACASAVPFTLEWPWPVARMSTAILLLGVFILARWLRGSTTEEVRRDEYGVIEAVSWLGLYVALNVAFERLLFYHGYKPVLFWGSYFAVWILPVAGLAIAVRDRHRSLIWVNLIAALATLATNKLYLGWPHHTWDPIVLGLLLIGSAVGVRRWLSAGPGGEREGITPLRILTSDKASLALVTSVAGAIRPGHAHHPVPAHPAPVQQPSPAAPDTFTPGGGSSGGGGASGSF